MAVKPRFLHVRDKVKMMGPTIPAPERYIDNEGFVRYNVGDPVPVGEARALGWMDPVPEPEPVMATQRGRKVRIADREKREADDSVAP